MNISFDIFNEHPEVLDSVATEEHIFYKSYLNFFAEKLSKLKSEIDNEENMDEDGARFTEINILHQDRGPATFWGYSKELKEKMESCFTVQDFQNFEKHLQMLRSKLLN